MNPNNNNANRKVILMGEWNSQNLGDMILCSIFMKIFTNHNPNTNTIKVDLSSLDGLNSFENKFLNLLSQKKLGKLSFIQYWINRYFTFLSLKRILKSKIDNNNNLIIVVGGELIHDYFSLPLLAATQIAKKKNISIIYNAVGVGKLNLPFSKNIFKRILNDNTVKGITTRDSLDKINIVNTKVERLTDIAIYANECYEINNKPRTYTIGLGLIHPTQYKINSSDPEEFKRDVFDNRILSMIEILTAKHEVHLFTNGDIADYQYAQYIQEKTNCNIILDKRPINDKDLVETISSFSCIIAFRLHAQIVAYSFDIPSFGLSWDNKINEWYKLIGKDSYAYMSQLDRINLLKISTEFGNEYYDKDIKENLKNEIECKFQEYKKWMI